MDAILNALAGLLDAFKGQPATIVLLFVAIAEGYFIFILRKEGREDRISTLTALKEVGEVLNDIKNFLAAASGKVV